MTKAKAVFLGGLAAVGIFFGLLILQHFWQDHQDHHLVLDLLKYNVSQGRILPLPGPIAAAPVVSAPVLPKVEKPEKP